MRHFMLAAGIAAIAMTAACSKGPDHQQPGEWETATTIKSVEMPGAPPQVAEMMRSRVGQSQTQRECLTPQRANDPLGEMRRMLSQSGGQGCTFTDQVFGGGTIRIRGTCQAPGGQGSLQLTMDGTFTETTLQATMAVNATGPNGTGMHATTEMRGRRIGDCTSPAPATPTGNSL
jgi:hypothetical protein